MKKLDLDSCNMHAGLVWTWSTSPSHSPPPPTSPYTGQSLGLPVKLSNFCQWSPCSSETNSACPSPSLTNSPWPATWPPWPALKLLSKVYLSRLKWIHLSLTNNWVFLSVFILSSWAIANFHLFSVLPAPAVMMPSFQTSLSGGSVDLVNKGF